MEESEISKSEIDRLGMWYMASTLAAKLMERSNYSDASGAATMGMNAAVNAAYILKENMDDNE